MSSTRVRASGPLSSLAFMCDAYVQNQASLSDKSSEPVGSSLVISGGPAGPPQSLGASPSTASQVNYALGIPGVVDFIEYDVI